MKNRTKYIVLSSVLAALVLVWVVLALNPERTYQVPVVKAPANITGIEITRGSSEKITLVLTNGKWMLEPGGFFAQSGDVNDMTAQLKTFEISDLVSGGALVSYGLDTSNRIEIKAYDGNKAVLDFFMGKTALTYRHTYVQLINDPNVYQAKGTFYYAFNKDIDGLKTRSISEIYKDNLTQVTIKEGGSSYTLTAVNEKPAGTNDGTGIIHWQASWKPGLLDDAKVAMFLQKLTPLTAAGLAPGKMDINTPYLRQIEMKTGKETLSLYIIRREETKDKNYIVGVQGNPCLFKITGAQGKDLLKSINEL
ncbi:MAG: DUF4340 domain-containing protein [Brevinematales bacterium]|jgi:hypothetical protein